MRKLARFAVVAGAMALIGGGIAATSTAVSAQDIRVRVGTQSPGYYKYRPQRYYYAPPRRYYAPPPRRYYYAPPRRNFLNCRWVPHRGRVCW